MKYIRVLILSILFATVLFSSQKDIPAIVPAKWLQDNISNSKVIVVDLRDEEKFKKGHIKGAVNIPALKKLFDDKFFMPKLQFLKETFSNAGINKDSLVVAYDGGDFLWAARLYWILETLGHKNVGLLKVGYKYWEKNQLPTSTKIVQVKKSNFIPRVDSSKVKTKLSTLMSIGKKTIIDGRKKTHYDGDKSLAKRFGHIPTAKNYACTQNYQATDFGNQIKDFKVLKKIYKDLPKDKEVILYCDGGAEAALNYIVMQELGYKVSVYDGSWLEWGNDKSVPIENPAKK